MDETNLAQDNRAAAPEALELRVLSGRQAGARAPMALDAGWVRLGREESNDIVLRDAPFAMAEVGWQEGQCMWRHADGRELPLLAGQGVRLGGFTLLLCSPEQPWTPSMPESWAIDAPSEDSDVGLPGGTNTVQSEDGLDASEGQGAPVTGEDASNLQGRDGQESPPAEAMSMPAEAMPMAAEADEALSRGSASQASGTARRSAWAVAAVLVIAVVAWMIWGASESDASRISSAAAVAAQAASAAEANASGAAGRDPALDLETVKRILARQRMGAGLVAEPGPNGRIVLRGVVPNDEVLEALLRPVVQAGIRVSLQVLTDREFEMRVQSLDALMPEGVSAKPVVPGRVRLAGVVESEQAIEALRNMAAQEMPEALGLELELLTRAVKLELTLAQAEEIRKRQPPKRPPMPPVAAVVGGPGAHVLLRDGTRIVPGGSINGLKLSALDEKGMTFVDGSGRSYYIAR